MGLLFLEIAERVFSVEKLTRHRRELVLENQLEDAKVISDGVDSIGKPALSRDWNGRRPRIHWTFQL